MEPITEGGVAMAIPYSQAARHACANFHDSDIEAAIYFCQQYKASDPLLYQFIGTSNDRLVKMGRRMRSLLDFLEEEPLEMALTWMVHECQVLMKGNSEADDTLHVPRVRFGKTEIQMPIVTLGAMRFQQEWGPRINNMNMVGSDCQDNLVEILRRAVLQYGMVHIETARGYGSSEIQLGCALKQLFLTTDVKREDLIIQVKVPAMPSVIDFRETISTSFQNLQIDYCDLFALHGFNYEEQLEWVFGKNKDMAVKVASKEDKVETEEETKEGGEEETKEGGEEDTKQETKEEKSTKEDSDSDDTDEEEVVVEETCMSVLEEFIEAGKIKHIGFSTHGPTEFICRIIATNKFSYCNMHYHYFGSYTASGGPDGKGNLLAAKMCQERDMGVFIISPMDKGGALYIPPKKLRALTQPDMEPCEYGFNWIWNHHKLEAEEGKAAPPPLHTLVIGAARPSDLDEAVVAAHRFKTNPEAILTKTEDVLKRLEAAKVEALGKEFADYWWKGLPKAYQCKSLIEHNQVIWLYTIIRAFGMLEFARKRYGAFENNLSKWDPTLTSEENIKKNAAGWGFVPGLPLIPGREYGDELVAVPFENRIRIMRAEELVVKWCATELSKKERRKTWQDRMEDVRRASSKVLGLNSSVHKQLEKLAESDDEDSVSAALSRNDIDDDLTQPNWTTSYDMRPWPDYPDQPKRV